MLAFAARVVYGFLKATTRPVPFPDCEEILRAIAADERLIVAFWHGHLGMVQFGYPGSGVCIQVSRHTDGEIISRAVAPFGVRTARGSASRGAIGSLKRMVEAYREGLDLAIAADGPRGPRHRAKLGAIHLAQATGLRLFPVACAPRRGIVFRSWDGFTAPLPFTRIFYAIGEPLRVPRDASPDEVEAARQRLEEELTRVTGVALRRARENAAGAPFLVERFGRQPS
ncbi:MAG: hypothetical protein QOD06_2991 [Candidatus Binatota bacterium]|nr:hypothetical protein [Candidatus Binatota bacterium]